MSNVSEPGDECQTAARLERLAALLREHPVSDRTAAIIDAQVMLIEQTFRTSPSDTADFAEMVARLMRAG
jgi:hypothetical protein